MVLDHFLSIGLCTCAAHLQWLRTPKYVHSSIQLHFGDKFELRCAQYPQRRVHRFLWLEPEENITTKWEDNRCKIVKRGSISKPESRLPCVFIMRIIHRYITSEQVEFKLHINSPVISRCCLAYGFSPETHMQTYLG